MFWSPSAINGSLIVHGDLYLSDSLLVMGNITFRGHPSFVISTDVPLMKGSYLIAQGSIEVTKTLNYSINLDLTWDEVLIAPFRRDLNVRHLRSKSLFTSHLSFHRFLCIVPYFKYLIVAPHIVLTALFTSDFHRESTHSSDHVGREHCRV